MPGVQTKATFYSLLASSKTVLTAATGGEGGDLVDVQITKRLDGPWHVHFGLTVAGEALGIVVAATGGPDGRGAVTPLLCELSLDNGATVDVRLIVTSAQRVLDPTRPLLVVDQDDLFALYGVQGVDRLTMIRQLAADILAAEANTLSFPTGHIGTSVTDPYHKGLFAGTAGNAAWPNWVTGNGLASGLFGALQFAVAVDGALSAVHPSIDANSDTIQNATKSLVARVAGAMSATDSAPPGSRGHYVVFSGDGACNHSGLASPGLVVGRVDGTVRTTFNGDPEDPGAPFDYHSVSRFASGGMTIEPKLADLYLQASFQGGRSNHGLPDNTKITALVVTGTSHESTATNWDASLPIIGTDSGLYYYPGFEYFVPMGPPVVVNDLAYDATNNILFVATADGVYATSGTPPTPYPGGVPTDHLASPNSTIPWVRMGTLAAPVEALWLDGVQLFARCGGSTKRNGLGIDGIYQLAPGDTSGAAGGYAGWLRVLHSGAPSYAGGTAAALYYVDKAKLATVFFLQPFTTTAPVAIPMPDGAHVTGIWSGAGYVYVLTDAGSVAMYAIAYGTSTLIPMNTDSSIQDPDTGAKAQIYRLLAYGATIDGQAVALFAATDGGIYWTADVTGATGWQQPNKDSGLTEFDARLVAVGRPRTVLTHELASLYVANAASFLVSNTGGDYWADILANRVSLVSFWAALSQQCPAMTSSWPDRNTGYLGTAPDGWSDMTPAGGGDVAILDVPDTNPRHRPPGVVWALRLDEHQDYTAREINLTSQAPLAGIQWHELAQLEANADVGVIAAAEQVALVTDTWLGEASTLQTQVVIQGGFTEDDDPQRDLAPTDLVGVTFNPEGFTALVAMTGAPYLVLEQAISQDGGLMRTTTTLGTTLSMAPADPAVLAADASDRITKRLRFGSA